MSCEGKKRLCNGRRTGPAAVIISTTSTTTTATAEKREAQLPQRDRATRCVSKLVPCFTSYGSYKVSNSKSDLQGHSRALTMVLFDRPHMVSY